MASDFERALLGDSPRSVTGFAGWTHRLTDTQGSYIPFRRSRPLDRFGLPSASPGEQFWAEYRQPLVI